MNDSHLSSQDSIHENGSVDSVIDKQIRLEAEKRATLEAERANAAQAEKHRVAEYRRNRLNGVSVKTITVGGVALVIIAVVLVISIPAFVLPALAPQPKTTYLTDSALEDVVNVNSLSTVDYVYKGVAEKKGMFDWVDVRVKYVAHVRASFDMTQIRFSIDHDSKKISATLPEPTIEAPVIDVNSLGYMPEGRNDDPSELISLCEEDATAETSTDSRIRDEAYENLKATIEGLTFPLIGSEYELVWEYQSEANTETEGQ